MLKNVKTFGEYWLWVPRSFLKIILKINYPHYFLWWFFTTSNTVPCLYDRRIVRLIIITGVIQQLYWPLFTNVSLTEVICLALYNRNIFCSFIDHAEYVSISCPTWSLPGVSLNNFLLLLFYMVKLWKLCTKRISHWNHSRLLWFLSSVELLGETNVDFTLSDWWL